MKNFVALVAMFLFVLSITTLSSNNPLKDKHKYIGVKKCGMCHKKAKDGEQLKVWKGSDHAKAYKSLTTAEADEIAKKAGFSTPAAETEQCLKCHVTGYNTDAKMKKKSFKMEDGVQCEKCHGPGSDYKSMKTMKSREKSVEKGLIVYENEAAIEKMCKGCHNEESPTYKPFVFKEKWAKVKHYIPNKK